MADKLAELPLVLPRTSQELNRAVELISRKVNEIIRTSRLYLDDITELNEIPGTLDAGKLFGSANLEDLSVTGFLGASEIETNYLTAGQILAITPINLVSMGATVPLNLSSSSPTIPYLDADKLDTQDGSYYLAFANHTGTLGKTQQHAQTTYKDAANTFTAGQIVSRTNTTDVAWRLSTAAGVHFEQQAGGDQMWGPAGSARDTRLSRIGTKEMRFDDNAGGAVKLFLTGEIEIDGALNHDGTTIGFFGAAPVTRPVLTYSRATETAAATQLRTALVALGLVLDSTVP